MKYRRRSFLARWRNRVGAWIAGYRPVRGGESPPAPPAPNLQPVLDALGSLSKRMETLEQREVPNTEELTTKLTEDLDTRLAKVLGLSDAEKVKEVKESPDAGLVTRLDKIEQALTKTVEERQREQEQAKRAKRDDQIRTLATKRGFLDADAAAALLSPEEGEELDKRVETLAKDKPALLKPRQTPATPSPGIAPPGDAGREAIERVVDYYSAAGNGSA